MKIVSFDSSKHAWDRKNRKGMDPAWRRATINLKSFDGETVSVDDIIPFAFLHSFLSRQSMNLLRKFADWYRDDLNRNSIGSERWLFQTAMRYIIRRVTGKHNSWNFYSFSDNVTN